MSKPKIYVFIGKPGVGKTTLIKKVLPNIKYIDVKSYIVPHVINDKWPEEKTLDCYKKMYEDINQVNEDLILEIGTNHAEFNVSQLERLQKMFQVVVILCILSIEENRKRYIERDEVFDLPAFEKRLKKKFPELHLPLIVKSKLPYFLLEMGPPFEEIQKVLKGELQKLGYN